MDPAGGFWTTSGGELARLAYPTKPVIDDLRVDDEGRLWVRRLMEEGEPPLYDVFDSQGAFVRSVRLGFRPMPYLPPRIRDGRLYAVVADELDTAIRTRRPAAADYVELTTLAAAGGAFAHA